MPGRFHLRAHSRRALVVCGIALLVSVPARAHAGGQTQAEYDARVRASKARAREILTQGARGRLAAGQRFAESVRAARQWGRPAPQPGVRLRTPPHTEDSIVVIPADRAPMVQRLSVTTIPTNVRANNTAGDASNTTQAEQSIAASGTNVLVAWNDGLGPPYQGYGFSSNGGQTFTDGGVPPSLAGWSWSSDPVVTVNEKTGVFYYCGLLSLTGGNNGIGVVPATVSGAVLTWGTPVLVRSVSNASAVLDKQWIVADSSNGNLYLTCSTFDGGTGDHIDFQRSTNGGASWSAAVQISSPGDNGAVQGSRPVVGPSGELYATWSALGAGASDYLRLRKSTTQGSSWGGEVTPASVYLNFGTGPPGFNRDRGVDFPSIAVDRTHGTHRGRVYLAWTESIDKYDDPLNTLGNRVEIENNNFFARANAFTPGQCLRGSLNTTTDADYFSFSAVQGTNYMFEADSIPNPLYAMRVFCGQDTFTRLAYTGDASAPAGGHGYILWTAPTSGTYYLRIAYVSGGALGGYRISTGAASPGPERARDSRDVFASYSDNGTIWSTPARVNDSVALYDEYLPEVIVGADGMPYVSWFDWRDDGCAGRSYQYAARSPDGGASWSPNRRASDVQNDWTSISLNSNLAPDMGDYSHMCADPRYVRMAFADGRGGNPDVYTTRLDTWHQITTCAPDMPGDAGTNVQPSWSIRNWNPLFDDTYSYAVTNDRNWPLGNPGTVAVNADGTSVLNFNFAIPDTAMSGVTSVCLTVTNAMGTRSQSCCFNLTVHGGSLSVPPPPVAVPASFALDPCVPNPAAGMTTMRFTLPSDGAVQLRVYGPRGERVRTLIRGTQPAGPGVATWDGRDDRGQLVHTGVYFYELQGFGQSQVRRLVWLR